MNVAKHVVWNYSGLTISTTVCNGYHYRYERVADYNDNSNGNGLGYHFQKKNLPVMIFAEMAQKYGSSHGWCDVGCLPKRPGVLLLVSVMSRRW